MTGYRRVPPVEQDPERGDTLVEIVITLLIISIAVVALLGGLLASTSESITHRGITNLDSLLRSFAESARYQIEGQATFGPGTGPQFQACVRPESYKVVGSPNPATGAPGTAVTIFGLGLSSPGTVTFGGNPVASVTATGAPGGSTTTFNVPSGVSAGSTYSIAVSGSPAATAFTVTSDPPPSVIRPSSPLSGYTLSSSMDYWGGSSFNLDQPGCTSTTTANRDLQRLNLHMVETVNGNAASDSVSVVLANLKSKFPSNVSLTGTSSPQLGSPISLAAAVANAGGAAPPPTGTITWTVPTGTTPCASGAAPSSTCSVTRAGAGTYVATYSGDANYTGGNATPPYVVPRYPEIVNPPTLTSPVTPPNPTAPAALTFRVTFNGVAGYAPSGNIVWTGPCTGSTPLSGAGPTYTATCSAPSVSGGSYTETATYQAGSDPNYTDGTANSTSVTVLYRTTTTVTVTPTNPTAPATLVFTATVAGGNTLTATPTWAGPACNTTTWNASTGIGTCTLINEPVGSYTETATYPGDPANASSSGSATARVGIPATVTVPQGSLTPGNGTNKSLTFTATVSGSFGIPTGTITWVISATGPAATGPPATCPATSLNLLGQATCTITGNLSSSSKYTVTANYSGDSVYFPASGTSPVTNG